ncbi:hypothetical protein BRC86_04915 [Halobacteriales archaeon QS_3_64_16]|jgi:hypothetical protein|nr:MAG: hypothetical protein BRC86_04915 [Halobacteriales archaeon QS_3_64_16]
MNARVGYLIGSTLLLLGAFAIGGVLHQSLVQGSIAVTAPASVLGIGAGIALIAVGRRLEGRYEDEARSIDTTEGSDDGTDGTSGEDTDREAAFDERWAPFDAADLEKYERDDSESSDSNRR